MMELKDIELIKKPRDLKEYIKDVMIFVKEEYFKGWPDFGDKINEIIQQNSCKEIAIKDYSTWRRKQAKDLVEDKDSVYYWKELYDIVLLKIITENGGNTKVRKSIHQRLHQGNEEKKVVRYGVFPCQDTILPLFFEELYNDFEFEVEFITFNDWNDGLEAFLNDKIDVALHNFPTSVAFNAEIDSKSPLFFWPFFSFKGYSLWARTSYLNDFVTNNNISKSLFERWSKDEKKKFFQDSRILVEKKTDFEWVLKEYLKNIGCSQPEIAEIDRKCFRPYNTNYAKSKFVNEVKYSIYVTNPIHTFDLQQPKYTKDFTLLLHGNDFTNHNNFNGLICSVEYYNNNQDIIHKLIEKWFIHTDALKRKIANLSMKNPLLKKEHSVSITIPSLLAFLNKETASEIKEEHLKYIYDPTYNKFYDNPLKAFRDFYDIDLSNEEIIQNYIGIARIELNKGIDNSTAIRTVICSIKDMMNSI